MATSKAKIEEQTYTRNKLVATLTQIKHPDKGLGQKRDNVSKLTLYVDQGLAAAKADPELFAHFVAWNESRGKVRDAKVALPILGLRGLGKQDKDLAENAVAHMLLLSPRDLLRSYDFNWLLTQSQVVTANGVRSFESREFKKTYLEKYEFEHGAPLVIHSYPLGISAEWRRLLEEGLTAYLGHREENFKRFERAVLSHRRSMKFLYRLAHKKPSPIAQQLLFDENFPKNSVLYKVSRLKDMSPKEAAGTVLEYKLPFEVVVGAVGKDKVKSRDLVLAMMEGMTGTQLITNVHWLEDFGVMNDPVLKTSFEQALSRAKKDKTTATLKAGRAAETLKGSVVATKMVDLQRAKVATMKTLEGDWLIAGDSSGSMKVAMELARKIAAIITAGVKGSVYLVFFNTSPNFIEVTGMSYDQILEKTRRWPAGGGTSIGCAVDYIRSHSIMVNGIVIISDGGERSAPFFAETYKKYCKELSIEPTVYLLRVQGGDPDWLSENCAAAGVQLEKRDLGNEIDYYSLPNIIGTLSANRYALFDEILETPLLTIERALERRADQ